MREARGRHCLLLNEDSELQPGATRALVDVLEADPGARLGRGRALLTSEGRAHRVRAAAPRPRLAAPRRGVPATKRYAVQSKGSSVREVGWTQSSAMLVRRVASEQVGDFDPDFFVCTDETDFGNRMHDAGWRIPFAPDARAIHHNQLSTDEASMSRRIVEFHRNRDLYLRKHHSNALSPAWSGGRCWTWSYLVRAAAALRCCRAATRSATCCMRGQELRPRTRRGSA